MDSLSSSYRNKPDHSRWNNRHEDLKRATSSLHHTELEGSVNSRLDKARNFARGKRTFGQDRESREVAMAMPSMQKRTALRHEKKQYDVTKGPAVKDSGSPAPSMDFGSDKTRFKHVLKSEMAGKGSVRHETSVDKDCKRFSKISPNQSSAMGSFEAAKDKEAKLHFRSPKSTGVSTDEVSWNSRSSVNKAHKKDEVFWINRSSASKSQEKRKLSFASEQVLEERVPEAPISFPKVARRARSERKRDEHCKSQSSKSASLDGFVAELEEALFRKQDSVVDSGIQSLTDLEDQRGDSRGVDATFKNYGLEARQDEHNLLQKDVQLEETSEMEEGELEPDDDLQQHGYQKCMDVGKRAFELQPETNTNESGHTTDTLVEERQNKCSDSICHVSTVLNRSNASELDAKDVLAGRGDQSQAITISEDMVIEHVHGHQDSSAVAIKGDQSPEEVMTNLEVQVNDSHKPTLLIGSSCLEAFKDDNSKSHSNSDVSGNEKQSADGLVMQAETNVKSEVPSNVEESDELSVYNNKQKKLKVGSLQLSLALPGSSIISTKSLSPNLVDPKESEKSHQFLRHVRSFSHCQSETFSDGFTTSFSLSSLIHIPSCSLNCSSREDQELSCSGSRVFQQGHWKAPAGDDRVSADVNRSVTSLFKDRPKQKYDGPLHQQASQNGKQGNADGDRRNQDMPRNNQTIDGMKGTALGHGVASSQVKDLKMTNQGLQQPPMLLESISELPCLPNRMNMERVVAGARSPSIDKIGLREIASEPVAVMAQTLQELPDSFLEGLKALAKELLGSFAKRDEFLALQHIISTRTDLTEQTLLRAHPTQLEILVALRTGMQRFVQQSMRTLTYKCLIEIFLQTRCRNVECQQTLPVNRCECQVCSEKSGFCHECMCMVCSKFDSDSNTSYWVGCDICMHWCHTDCGLRMSHIKPTPAAHGGVLEMQYQCLSCGHRMELFGFVKGVFTNFATSWGVETLAKELDCIRRVFHGSEDARGRQLYRIAEKMLQKLEANVGAGDVRSSMLRFFSDFDCGKDGGVSVPLKQENLNEADAPEGPKRMGFVIKGEAAEVNQIASGISVTGSRLWTEPEELNGIIQKKLSDALMLQAHANAARQDATNLRQLVASKSKTLEEDFALKYSLLRLEEAEEFRRKRLHELQALEKSQQDFEAMKLRIESDIKNLMMKVDMPKLQLA